MGVSGYISKGTGTDFVALALSCASLALLLITTSVMNVSVFPLFDGVFPYARDISVLTYALVLLALGLIAGYRPRLLPAKPFLIAAAAVTAVGGLLFLACMAARDAVLLTTASCLVAAGRAGATVAVGLSLTRFGKWYSGLAVCCAFLLSYLGRALDALTHPASIIVFIAMPLAAIALCAKGALPVLDNANKGEAPLDMSVVRPAAFLSPVSKMYVCLFLFHFAFGYSLKMNGIAEVGAATAAAAGVIASVLAYCLLRRKRIPGDLLTKLSVLAVVAGFAFAAAGAGAYLQTAAALLQCGSSLFDLVAWTALVAIGMRNPSGAVTVIAWGRGISSLGTICGAGCGISVFEQFQATPDTVFALSSLMLLAVVAYALFSLNTFSFRETVDGIEQVETAETAAFSPTERFELRCDEIASACKLTPRELEVFRMLARGRNREYIQEELVVSRNTVKAHVKHIYAKLDIHSHQELIDLVEADGTPRES